MTEGVLGWWFAQRDPDGEVRLPHGDGRIVRVGETLTVAGPVVLCERGLHASESAYDALTYAPGDVLCRVRLSGEVVRGADKMAATERATLAMIDATRLLRAAACCFARGALEAERLLGREPDPRSWAAVEVAAHYVAGVATEEERSAAWSAAWSAAESAAWSAARSAARDAAWSAAESAVGSAHRDAMERLCIDAIGGTP